MKLTTLQKAIAASAVLHLLLAIWFLPRAGTFQPSAPRGVVDLELIEPVTHEADSSSVDEASPERAKARPLEPARPPQMGNSSQRTVSAPGPLGDPQSVARETDVFIQQVSRLIDQNKIYPREALSREEEGKVVVAMTLDRQGVIVEAKVEQPCAFSRLNQAALQSVQNIGKFPPIPETIPVPLHLHIPIQFRIER